MSSCFIASADRRNSLPNTLVDRDGDHARRRVGSALFLGLSLALGHVQGVLLDAELSIVECVEVELDSLQSNPPTADGLWHEVEGSARQPIDLVLAGVDALLDRFALKWDLGRVVSIAGSAHSAMVLLNVSFPSALAAVPSSSSFREHFARSEAFTTTAVPTALDTTTHGQHSVLVKAASAAGCAFPNPPLLRSGVVQLLRLPWKKAAHVRSLAGLVESLLIGELVGWEATGASEVTSLWDGATGEWSARAADLVAGGTGAGIQLLQRLGGEAVRRTGESGGFVSEYLQDRHGFAAECTVAPFISESLAAYSSLCPSAGDAVLSLGRLDTLTFPLPPDRPLSTLYQTLPHPAQHPGEARRFVGQISTCNGEAARVKIMAAYANASISVLSQMVSPVVPPGGALGYDDKLFIFLSPNKDVHPFGVVEGAVRFENGVATHEFGDLRANPRCLIESQFLTFRSRYSAIVSALQDDRPTMGTPARTALGLSFDPFNTSVLPKRVLVTESSMDSSLPIMGILGEVFGAPVSKANRHHFRGGDAVPESTPSAAAMGSAYIARWHAAVSPPSFEDFIISLLNAQAPAPVRPVLRPRPSRSSLSGGNSSPLALSAISELGDARPPARTLHRSKSAANLLSAKVGAGVKKKERGSKEHSLQTLELLATPDRDAVRAYCSMVPEFLRLEELFVKGLIPAF